MIIIITILLNLNWIKISIYIYITINRNDQKLRVLKEEKREIKNKILAFENKFFEENKRRIKFKGDIIGYEDLYQQYFVYFDLNIVVGN